MSENRRRYVFVLISRRLDFRLGTCGEARRVRIAGIYGGQDAAARRGGVLWGENINGYRYSAVAFRRACSSVLCVFLLSVGGVEFPRRCLRVGRVVCFSFCRQTARGSLGGSDGRQWGLFVVSGKLQGGLFGGSCGSQRISSVGSDGRQWAFGAEKFEYVKQTASVATRGAFGVERPEYVRAGDPDEK